MKVLLVTDQGATSSWRIESPADWSVRTVPSVAAAAELIAAESVDAVLLSPAALADAVAAHARELERRDAELERSRAQFRDAVERIADGIIVVDREGVIRFANPAAGDLFRTPREQLTGTPFGFPMVVGETTELDLLSSGEVRVAEMRVVDAEWEGEQACIATLRDITARKRSEESARRLIREQAARAYAEQTARRFRFLAESSTVLSSSLDYRTTLAALARLCVEHIADWAAIYVADEQGHVTRLEVTHRDPAVAELAAALRDQPIDPAGAHPVLEVLARRQPRLVRHVDEAMLGSLAQNDEHLQLLTRVGITSFMLVPLVARDRCLGAIGLASCDPERPFDRDDLAQAQDLALRAALAVDNARLYQVAQQADRAKTDLIAVISHDLRTPLNSIIGHAELLQMGIPDTLSEATLERVGRIRMSAAHQLYLIDQLLSFARLEAGGEDVRIEDVDAAQIVREVAAVVEPLAAQRNLRFELNATDARVPLRTDPDKLRQVLLNLTGNAVKYTEDGGVTLSLRTDGNGAVEFTVEDTGIGIPEEHLGRIFEPFWQLDPTQRSRDGGTGLGLSVVQKLVRMLGGGLGVQSVLGDGSTFTVRLPQREKQEVGCVPPPSRSRRDAISTR